MIAEHHRCAIGNCSEGGRRYVQLYTFESGAACREPIAWLFRHPKKSAAAKAR